MGGRSALGSGGDAVARRVVGDSAWVGERPVEALIATWYGGVADANGKLVETVATQLRVPSVESNGRLSERPAGEASGWGFWELELSEVSSLIVSWTNTWGQFRGPFSG